MPFLLAATNLTAPEYAVGWFTLSLINAGLAQSKNRSGLIWWLVSLVVGPFATFLIVVSGRLPAAAPIAPEPPKSPIGEL